MTAIESRLSDRLIKAPFAGVLGLRKISVGALVEPGDLITTLDDDTQMKLDLAVPNVYLGSLRPGMGVVATTRAYGERQFTGEVRSIDSRVDPVTRSVQVRVLLPNPERLLKPGMLMQVTLRKDPREALAGGVDGLDVVRRIVASASAHLRPGGGLFLEVGADQGEGVRRLLEQDSSWKTVRVTPDLAGRERFVVALA